MTDGEVTLPTAAQARGVGRSTLQRAADKGQLKARRIGRYWITTLAAVDEWLVGAAARQGPTAGTGAAYKSKRTAQD